MDTKQYCRGDIFMADLGQGIGSEQAGLRPVVIVQNNAGNRNSPTVIVAPVTSRKKHRLPTHLRLGQKFGLEKHSLLLAEQLRTLDKTRLTEKVGALDAEALEGMDQVLRSSLNLQHRFYFSMYLCPVCSHLLYRSACFFPRRTEKFPRRKARCQLCRERSGFAYDVTIRNV